MSFFRPSLRQLQARRISDFEAELGSQNSRIPRTIENALAVSGAGTAHGLHGRLDNIARNAFPHKAEDESMIQWAAFYGVFQREATRATGIVKFFGIIGSEVPAGSVVVRSDGYEYETMETLILNGDSEHDRVPARAKVSGAAGNTTAFILNNQVPIVGVTPPEFAGTGAAGGTDAEDYRSLRHRLLDRISNPPKGGGPGDYIRWAKEVPGVTRAWEHKWTPKIGYVTVLFMRDNDAEGGPFPDSQERQEVADRLALYAPIIAPDPIVMSPVDFPLTLSIELTVEDYADADVVKAAIIKSIQDMLAVRAIPARFDDTVFFRSWISEAISITPGERDHKLLFPVDDLLLPQWGLASLAAEDVDWP